ncbi:hypothetical protein [Lactobacillus kefiranofaciens]|uniref:hypothetical protein n=1 Tax=Lactobacillus kefiranofaciens TaxID=267818 RepID=UPI0006D26288|nr:hypothetical protein [Lactobacillus kefiranofaciens]MCJ2172595.1 hypothetical protein [Lactobacillus kefiranofaciens]MCP9331509.1 hypothetical protein [Lactobacillus kefiranofaciens]MDF4142573.1 hypothetical protein [Lactobacillus kefiranofaciens]PAK97662.1 hypothetical protein B8W86_08895 [Lactobacillus kefiranofaciens]QNT43829.1 hypothetical protein ICI50_08420 [Lactobacillus kefiranofaciens]
MMLKINQTASKDAQARTLLKELIKVHQIHQAYNVRDLTDADEQILERAFNATRELMPRISAKKIKFANKEWDSLFNFLMAEQISFARVLTNGDDNLNEYVQAKNQAQQAYALAETAMTKLENKQ